MVMPISGERETFESLIKEAVVLSEGLRHHVSEWCGEVRRLAGNTQTEAEFMEEYRSSQA